MFAPSYGWPDGVKRTPTHKNHYEAIAIKWQLKWPVAHAKGNWFQCTERYIQVKSKPVQSKTHTTRNHLRLEWLLPKVGIGMCCNNANTQGPRGTLLREHSVITPVQPTQRNQSWFSLMGLIMFVYVTVGSGQPMWIDECSKSAQQRPNGHLP